MAGNQNMAIPNCSLQVRILEKIHEKSELVLIGTLLSVPQNMGHKCKKRKKKEKSREKAVVVNGSSYSSNFFFMKN